MAGSVNLRFLGAVQVSRDGVPVTGFRSRKALALLGYLAVRRQPIPRDQLIALLWEDQPEERGRANLSWVLNRISTLLPGCLQADRNVAELLRSPAYELDTDTFDRLLATGEALALAAALALYRGELMDGISLDGCAEFELWLEGERERWRQRAMQAAEALSAHHSRRGEYRQALDAAQRLLALEPWQESAHRQVMDLLAHCGQRTTALEQFETCRRILARELGVKPAPETLALYERIRAGAPACRYRLPAQPTPFVGREVELAQVAALLGNPDCRLLTIMGPGGIGKTRLALRAAAEATAFMEGVCFVPLAGVSAAERLVSVIADALRLEFRERQAPVIQLVNHLHGRQMLLILDSFEHLLQGKGLLVRILEEAPEVKLLVTSRECLNLRWEWRFEIGGLAYPATGAGHDLGAYSAVRLFTQSARRISPPFSLSAPTGEQVVRICRLVDGLPLAIELAAAWVGTRTCQEIAGEIGHNLGILATSMQDVPLRHQSLRAAFEHSWRLLTCHEQAIFAQLSVFRGVFGAQVAGQVAGASGGDLQSLVDKSLLRLSSPGRYEMHDLLRQYAAEKLAAVPAEYEAAHIRHRDWLGTFLAQRARALLGPDAGQALAAVKREVENISAVWEWIGAELRIEDVEHGLEGLIWFSRYTGPFFEGENFVRVAADRARALVGESSKGRAAAVLLCRLLAERARFLNYLGMYDQAIAAAQEVSEVASCQPGQTVASLAVSHLQWGEALLRQSHLEAARVQSERALALAHAAGLQRLEVECTSALAEVCVRLGESQRAQSLCQQALALSREIGDPWVEGDALSRLGLVSRLLGDNCGAQGYYEQVLPLTRQIGHRRGEALALANLGLVLRQQGDWAGARARYEQALQIHREAADRQGEGDALGSLGGVCLEQDDYAGARDYYEQALRLYREIGDRQGESRALDGLGAASARQGDCARALAYLDQALHICRQAGDRRGEMWTLGGRGFVLMCLGAYARATLCFEDALRLARELGEPPAQAEVLTHLALLFNGTGDQAAARAAAAQALAIAQELGERRLRAGALTALGQALETIGDLDEAIASYVEALALRRQLGERNRSMECLAGLARAALARGAAGQALALVEEILVHLQTYTLEGVNDPFAIRLGCYRILRAQDDPRAVGILASTAVLLQEQADRIEDEALRRSFLDAVPAHVELAREAAALRP